MSLANICKKCGLKNTCEGLPEYFSGCLSFREIESETADEVDEISSLYGACG
ncbi:MAG: hypothetical protein ACYCUW_01660 [bacterium]